MPNTALATKLNDALNRRDRDEIIALFTQDGVFRPSRRASGEARGAEQVADKMLTWLSQFAPGSAFAAEHEFYAGDEGYSEWRFTGTDLEGAPVDIHGIDYFRFAGGRIAVKDSFVKF